MSNWIDFTAKAGSSSLTQYSVVTATSADTVIHTTAVATASAHGVLQNAPTSTAHTGSYRAFGESQVRPTSVAVVKHALLTAATGGMAQSATASSAQACIGFALEAISASTARGTNDTIRMFVNLMGEV